jgi:hypothetical protein
MVQLAHEFICSLILSHLSPRSHPDLQTLLTCALVDSEFRRASRDVVLEKMCLSPMIGLTEIEHDWRTKRVNRTARVVNGLLDLADHSPGGACTSVRILYLDSGMLEAPKGETAKNIVARLPCLRHLVFFGVNWVAFAASVVETLTQGADLKKTMPSIDTITISASNIDSSDGDHRAMHVQPAHLAMWRLIDRLRLQAAEPIL